MKFDNKYILLLVLVAFFSCKDQPTKPRDPYIPPSEGNYREIEGRVDWSRIADIIVFTHLPQNSSEVMNGDLQIWTMDLQTGEREFITPGDYARWSLNGKYIAFSRGGTIWLRDMSTSEEKKIVPFTAYFPCWSPDNNSLAFDTPYKDDKGASAIWKMSFDSTVLRDISIHGTGEWRSPDWSPNGERILHYRYIGIGTSELFTMDTAGQNPIRLTNDTYQDESPRYSHDGKKIVWVVNGGGGRENPVNGIWIMNSDGTDKNKVVYGRMPSFSRDGKKIIYFGAIDSLKVITLLTVNLDGTNIQPVWLL